MATAVQDPPRQATEPGTSAARELAHVWRWQASHPWWADALLAGLVFVFAVWGPLADGDDHGRGPGVPHDLEPGTLTVTLLAVAAGTLVLRRRYPLAVWAASLPLAAAAILHGGEPPAVLAVPLVALYTVGALRSLRTALLMTGMTAAVCACAVTLQDGMFGDRTVTLLAVLGVGAAAGVAVRSQRLAVAAAEARARQAEVTREEEAERRVTDERLRIARELHDVLAHHISVIDVQAGVARHLLDVNPGAARTALGLVRESSRTVLSEMTTVLGLLRTGEDDLATQPAPGVGQVEALAETMRRAGLAVSLQTSGQPYPLGELADLTVYRVVQEGLTNALKHGAGMADLDLAYTQTGVRLEVRNPLRPLAPQIPSSVAADPEDRRPEALRSTGGHGLVGIRERVSALGGHVSVGTVDGRFVVTALIPRQVGS